MPSRLSTSKTKKVNCNSLLFLGALLLCAGLCLGFSKNGNPSLVLILLGCSIATFSAVVIVLLRSHELRIHDPKKLKSEPKPEMAPGIAPELDAKAGMNANIKASDNPAPKREANAEPAPEAGKGTESVPKPLPMVEAKAEPVCKPSTDKTSEIQTDGDSSNKSGMSLLMGTPLGDLLLSALLRDPENAGRFVTEAILQAQASSSIRLE